MTDAASPQPRGTFFHRFWPLVLLGLLGVLTLPFVLVPMIQAGELPEGVPEMPLPALVALSMINPILMLAAGAALGAWLAPKIGLVSLVAERVAVGRRMGPDLRAALPLAIGLGLALAVVTLLLDAAFQPLLSPQWRAAAAEFGEAGGVGSFIAGLFYGGITEEVMLRWGMMTFFLWAIWRLFQRGRPQPSASAAWAAILLAAVLFGLSHLPAAAALAPLDGMMVVRTVAQNAIGGALFGWLFWRRHLEAAMVAHASTHVGFAMAGLLGVG